MSVHFDKYRMQQTVKNHELWWNGKLGRPLVRATVVDAYEKTVCPYPVLTQSNCHDFSLTPEQIVDAWDAKFSSCDFCGDAYPHINLDSFGPGVIAAFCGAKLDNSSGQVWFKSQNANDISNIHAAYDKNNVWVKRIKEIMREGVKRWQGSVIIGFPDLGGILDIVATLVGTEELLFALIEQPDEVNRLADEIQTAWYEAYYEFADILKEQGAFTDWNGLLSSTLSYITQCDFSIMISNDMFREFTLRHLIKDTNRLDNVIYHLDGVGALQHLDSILSIEKLKAVQFVYGEGQPSQINWIDVYKKIDAAGKRVMLVGGKNEYLETMKLLSGINPYSRYNFKKDEKQLMNKILEVK